jgi:hypothetical protein
MNILNVSTIWDLRKPIIASERQRMWSILSILTTSQSMWEKRIFYFRSPLCMSKFSCQLIQRVSKRLLRQTSRSVSARSMCSFLTRLYKSFSSSYLSIHNFMLNVGFRMYLRIKRFRWGVHRERIRVELTMAPWFQRIQYSIVLGYTQLNRDRPMPENCLAVIGIHAKCISGTKGRILPLFMWQSFRWICWTCLSRFREIAWTDFEIRIWHSID